MTSAISQFAERYGVQALLAGHEVKATTRYESYALFYHPDGRLWSHGFTLVYGWVGGPPSLSWALNTLSRLADEKSEAEFPRLGTEPGEACMGFDVWAGGAS